MGLEMALEITKTKYSLDDLYRKLIDEALMVEIAREMNKANNNNVDREVFLNSLLAKDVGTLFSIWKKQKAFIDAGKFDITRGAHTFVGQIGFSYGACAYVSKEARRGGWEIRVPTKNKSSKPDAQKMTMLFGQIEGLTRVKKASTDDNQGQMDIMDNINR